jgi:hypothetical protein
MVFMASRALERELPALTCALEIRQLLRAGDRLVCNLETGWRLLRADVRVSPYTVQVMMEGGIWYDDDHEQHDLGGQLAPLGDQLFPDIPSQTWAWAEDASGAQH